MKSQENYVTISRKDAIEQGLKQYYIGKPCKHGHMAPKRTKDSYCLECKLINQRKFDKANTHKKKAYYQSHREEKIKKVMDRQTGSEEYAKYQQEYRDKNKEKAAQYRKDNAGYFAFHAAKRRKAVKIATTGWAEQDEIKQLYIQAQQLKESTGEEYHVDHIIPLNHELVCGLHCKDNLRVITAAKNLRKRNIFEV